MWFFPWKNGDSYGAQILCFCAWARDSYRRQNFHSRTLERAIAVQLARSVKHELLAAGNGNYTLKLNKNIIWAHYIPHFYTDMFSIWIENEWAELR
jgi:hypothetical protein